MAKEKGNRTHKDSTLISDNKISQIEALLTQNLRASFTVLRRLFNIATIPRMVIKAMKMSLQTTRAPLM